MLLKVAGAAAIGVLLAAGIGLATAPEPVWRPEPVQSEALPPIEPLTAGPLPAGGFVTRLSNVIQPNGEPIAFDHLVSGEGWDPSEPSVLVVPETGWWQVGVNLTTLGSRYGGPSNTDVAISIVKNWDRSVPFLQATVAFESFENEPTGANAEGNSLLQPLYLEAGDRLEVVTVGGPDGLLLESNPSDGLPDGFATDEGPGTLSPHFFLLPV